MQAGAADINLCTSGPFTLKARCEGDPFGDRVDATLLIDTSINDAIVTSTSGGNASNFNYDFDDFEGEVQLTQEGSQGVPFATHVSIEATADQTTLSGNFSVGADDFGDMNPPSGECKFAGSA